MRNDFVVDELLKRPIKIQDIQAKDDKGRTRFHGAFTGGFSAGYFNSVGSKEGKFHTFQLCLNCC